MEWGAILNVVAGAFFVGAGKVFLDVYTRIAVHEEKHKRHDERLENLEKRPDCLHPR